MYTCCPNCRTVFRLSARHLQQAAGVVCCGRCEYSFNALSNIQESAKDAIANLQPLTTPEPETQLTDNPELQDVITDPAHRKLWENAESEGLSTEDTWSSENGDESAANGEQHADADDTGNFQSDEIIAEPDTPAEPKLSLVENSEQAEPGDAANESETPPETLVEDVEAFEAAVLATIHATEAKEWESSGPHFVGDDNSKAEAADSEAGEGEAQAADDDAQTDEADGEVLEEEADDWDIDESLEGVDQPEDLTVTEKVIELEDEPEKDEPAEDEPEESDTGEEEVSESASLEMTMEQQLEASYLADTGTEQAIEAADREVSEDTEDDSADAKKDDDDSSLAFLDQLAEGADENKSEEDLLGLSLEGEEADGEAADEQAPAEDDTARDIWLGEVTLESAKEDTPNEDLESADAADGDEDSESDEAEDEDDEVVEDIELATDDSDDTVLEDEDEAEEAEAEEDDAGEEQDEESDADEDETEDETEDEDEDEYVTEEIVLEGDSDIYEGESRADPYVAPSESPDADSPMLAAHNAVRHYLPTAGVVALALLLLTQVVHGFRYQITAGGGGAWLDSIYESLGMPLVQQWDLDAYDIRRIVGVGDETGSGVVEISAILTNEANKAQPYPTLRLVFTDRWDEVLAVRDLIPSEYSDSPPARGAKMVSGEQLAVDIRVQELDEALAANYRLEICLRERDQTLICR